MSDDADTEGSAPAGDPAKVDFPTFVLSLAATAVLNLRGDGEDDRVAGAKVNLEVAAQHIDIITMLEDKTRGNLSKAEQDLVQAVLYDLRMQYLDAAQRK